MPEGHTIHRLARDLATDLVGRRVRAESRQERSAAVARRLDGRALEATSAMGKHLFLHWDGHEGPEILHVHLGLVGQFRRYPHPSPEPSEALRLRLAGPDHAWDLTGAIISDLRRPDVLDEVAARLGPDPLRDDADPERFATTVRRSGRPIGDLLLDQAVIAGIGNVYRAEVLHLVGIHPARPGRSLTDEEIRSVWDTTREQLRLGLRRNRIVTVPLAGRKAARIPRSEAVHVYKQEVCRTCGTPVEASAVGGRTMFSCPACQPAP